MRYLVLMFLCLIAVIAYVQRVGINSVAGPIQEDYGINTEEFGALGSAWLIGYAVMQVPAGWLADRIGSRNALAIYAVLWSLLTGAIGLCPDFPTLLIVWFTMGMALAGVFPCAAKSIALWFPDTQKATASGLLGSSTMLGTGVASALTSWLVVRAQWSWQMTYVLYGVAGVVWAIAYYHFIPERGGAFASAPPMTRRDWGRLIGSVSMWLICGQQFFRAGAMIFFINWFPKFLKESRALTDLQAGVYTSWANIAAMCGGILGGFFSDWLLRRTGLRRLSRQGIAVVGMTTCSGLIVATYFIGTEEIAVALFSVGAFIATFGGVSGYTVTIEFGGRRVATVFSVMNMSGNLGAALFSYAAGALKERTGSWDPALFVFAGIFAIDAVCWALLNPQGPFFEDQHETR
jgi:MFS family permease